MYSTQRRVNFAWSDPALHVGTPGNLSVRHQEFAAPWS